MTQRTDRIDELLRQEIGQALEREVTDPRIGFVTVTDVETSPDLAHARVWVSIIGTPEQRKASLAALRSAMPFVRRGLNNKIRLRRIPELEVRLDETSERGTRMLHILDELAAGPRRGGTHAAARVPAHAGPAAAPRRRCRGRADDGRGAETGPAGEVEPLHEQIDRPIDGSADGSLERPIFRPVLGPAERSSAPGQAEEAMTEVAARVDLSAYAAAVPDEVLERLRGAHRVLTICHENPEADALGSALATALLVERLGGVATPVCADPMPDMYKFLPGMDRFRQTPDPSIDYDLLVVGDCGELERVGPVLETHRGLFERVPILDIDHHASNKRFGAFDWIDSRSSATCEMIALVAWRLGVPLDDFDGMLASALAGGVVMDTGSFQHPNVTPRTMVVAAALKEAGAPLSEIARRLYRSKPNTQLVLFGRVLARMSSDLDGRLVWSTLELADLSSRRRGPGGVRGSDRSPGPVVHVGGRHPVQGRDERRHSDQRPNARRRSGRDRSHRDVRRRRPRSGGRSDRSRCRSTKHARQSWREPRSSLPP